ncbi:MAG TPA: TadE/TadG family type IV pilus assembly protein [Myxococcaceae bacterium]|nr:TadE/TadG family type IV pilus assembly protein [Myxococcaceae bacterium]
MVDSCVRRLSPRASRKSGQVAVEAALVMPLFVFLILGILQLGLTAQARVMAKYAAYRAARVGAMHHADPKAIQAAAIFHLLPVLVGGSDVILPTGDVGEVVSKFGRHNLADNQLANVEQVKTVICGPVAGEFTDGGGQRSLRRADQQALNARGSRYEVDFDDPVLQSRPANFYAGLAGADELRRFNRLRLRVQVQLLYRMPIPFANWVITKAFLGTTMPSVLMMPKGNNAKFRYFKQYNDVLAADQAGIYVVPINVSYAFRMQSNLFLDRFDLPERNECIHYGLGQH